MGNVKNFAGKNLKAIVATAGAGALILVAVAIKGTKKPTGLPEGYEDGIAETNESTDEN